MNKINYCGHTHDLGESWNELSKRDALIAHKILNRPIVRLVQPDEVIDTTKLAIFMAIMDITQKDMREIEELYEQEYGDVDGRPMFLTDLQAMTDLLDFLYEEVPDEEAEEEENPTYRISPTLTRQHFKEIELKDEDDKIVNLYGPEAGFKNISFYEFTYIAAHYSSYAQSGDDDTLNKLLAIVYRPPKESTQENLDKNYEGDIRLPLLHYEATLDRRAALFEEMNPELKLYLAFWISCCYMRIVDQFSDLFEAEPDKKSSDIYGWAGVIQAVAGSPHLIDDTVSHNYYTILQKIHLDMINQEEMEKRMKSR